MIIVEQDQRCTRHSLPNQGYCLSTNSPLNVFIKQTNILEKGGKRIWLLLSQTAETKENQNKTKTKWIINSPLPILWSLTLQLQQKNCTQKTLAPQTSCELHVDHMGVEPLCLQLLLLSDGGKESIHFLWSRPILPAKNWGVEVQEWPELHITLPD